MVDAIDFIHDLSFSDLPKESVHEAVRCLTDTIGVAVAATKTDLSKIIRNHAVRQFGGTGARLWFDGRTSSPAGAALANGMTIDSLDAHDGHKLVKGHIGCAVIPALIAVMEQEKKFDARELLTSIVIGYEIGTRAGIALHTSACDYHTSGAWVTLACAALGARQLGLDRMQMREALGIAEYHGPRSQMMRCIDAPTMVKDGSGWGAMAGVSAAYLAADGFTGAPAITLEDPQLASIWNDLGKNWQIAQQYIKLYPVCRWAQPAVEAALSLVKEHSIDPEQIEEVLIDTFHEAKRLVTVHPVTTEQAQYSLPFSVGAALAHGTIGVNEVTDGLHDPLISKLSAMVRIEEDEGCNNCFPARRLARATLKLKDGSILRSGLTEPKGDPEDKLSDDVIRSKFSGLTTPVLGTEQSELLYRTIQNLPAERSCVDLFDLLATP
jgi:2-methylcitrate dehydratase PrpD